MSARTVAGILLTGGSSRRMGVDKASLGVDAQPMAERIGAVLAAFGTPVLEVGPGPGLPSIQEPEPGRGPLVALGAAVRELRRVGAIGPAVVLACDLPLVNREVVELLVHWAGRWCGGPACAGMGQPLCTRWAVADLMAGERGLESGKRSLKGLPGVAGATLLTEKDWGHVGTEKTFGDADRRSDLMALGVTAGLEDPNTGRPDGGPLWN